MGADTTAFLDANARYAVLGWEPVSGSKERINVGALVDFDGQVLAKPLIRSEVLRCMYGSAGDEITTMITGLLEAISNVGRTSGWDAALAANPLNNFCFHPQRNTYATNEADLFRQIVLMHCSLSVLAEETGTSADEIATPEREVNQQWAKKVREGIQIERPALSIYFNREAVLVEGGVPVKFGLLSPKLAAHFGLLRVIGQGQGMKDARAKMWELSLAKERNPDLMAALVFGIPSLDDVTISNRQQSQLQANTAELQQEARHRHVNLCAARTVAEAVNAVIALT